MNLTISASAEPITVGENATVVVTGFPLTSYGAPSGNVTVTVGDKIFSGILVMISIILPILLLRLLLILRVKRI